MKKEHLPPAEPFRWRFYAVLTGLALILVLSILMPKRSEPPSSSESDPAPPSNVESTRTAQAETASGGQIDVVPRPVSTESASAIETTWGIQVSSVQLAMGGTAVDLRYKVVEPDKAAALAAGNTRIYVVDEATGTKIFMPSFSDKSRFPARDRALLARQRGSFPPAPKALVAGKTNSVLLPNLRQLVKSGTRLTLVVGDSQANHLPVQ